MVGEGGFREPLAVVEAPVDGDRRDVAAEAGELALLDGAHPPFGVEHHDPSPLDAEKSARHRAAGVTRGGDEHGHRPPRLAQSSHQARHGPRRDVLERESRPVVELEHPHSVLERDQRDRKVERLGDECCELVLLDLTRCVGREHGGGGRRQVGPARRHQVGRRQARDGLRQVETAVGCEALE